MLNSVPHLLGAPIFQSVREFEKERKGREQRFLEEIESEIQFEIDWDTVPV